VESIRGAARAQGRDQPNGSLRLFDPQTGGGYRRMTLPEADGDRTRQGALPPSPVLKFVDVRAVLYRPVSCRAAEVGVCRFFVPPGVALGRDVPGEQRVRRQEALGAGPAKDPSGSGTPWCSRPTPWPGPRTPTSPPSTPGFGVAGVPGGPPYLWATRSSSPPTTCSTEASPNEELGADWLLNEGSGTVDPAARQTAGQVGPRGHPADSGGDRPVAAAPFVHLHAG